MLCCFSKDFNNLWRQRSKVAWETQRSSLPPRGRKKNRRKAEKAARRQSQLHKSRKEQLSFVAPLPRPPSHSPVSFDQLATHSRQSPQDPPLFFHHPTPSFNLPTPSPASCPKSRPGSLPTPRVWPLGHKEMGVAQRKLHLLGVLTRQSGALTRFHPPFFCIYSLASHACCWAVIGPFSRQSHTLIPPALKINKTKQVTIV